ncbi:MAG TPA: PspA/IM30 family protein [Bryobacteraceae bacterium]|jgi:phage shock protein A|nr:PspA/IM30 family protein [Bryobacteraceae bacterium]
MGFFSDFFSRGGRVVRGQANKGMDRIEDATFEATVKQTVRDMRTELAKTINASAEAMSNYNRLETEYAKYVQQSQDWYARANQALDAGNEELAKKALARKAEVDQQIASLKPGVEAARNASESLKQRVADLKRRIDEAERTATTLVARKNAAMAQRKVAEAMSGVAEADNAFAALKSFEESVAREEAKAKAFDQLASAGKDDVLEAEFAELEGHSVESELAQLKAARAAQSLPAGQPQALSAGAQKQLAAPDAG